MGGTFEINYSWENVQYPMISLWLYKFCSFRLFHTEANEITCVMANSTVVVLRLSLSAIYGTGHKG